IGGGLGWAFGGPIGGILGFAFGSMVDGMKSGATAYRGTQSGDFSVALMVLTAAVMKADGKVVRAELDYVKNFLKHQFGEQEGQNKVLLLREILKQEYNVQEVSQQIKQFMEYPSRLQLLHFLFGISSADGAYHAKEVDMIILISNYLGVRLADLNSIKAMFVKDVNSAYKILEVPEGATDAEVRKAYHKMAVKYHPDKVAHLGGDVKRAATDKFQKLNGAYEEIKKRRGIK
ncbi:MAG: TerB family tellurite resistance protein, partial [Bacteroidota bacterium]|nr:TerB family tellurite resistance protein [Bacteroidota bacterium]